MTTEYTKAERDKIALAFDRIEEMLERTEMRMPYDWKQAFKYERRECSSVHAARAIMVESFAKGVRKPLDAASLYCLREGCRTAHLIGAAVAERVKGWRSDDAAIARQYLRDDLMHLADEASLAHKAAINRMLERHQNLGAS